MSKNEVVKKESSDIIAKTQKTLDQYGLDFSDISIARVSIQQALSQLVQNGVAKPSQIANHTTEEILGGKEDAFKFVVVGFYKSVLINDANDQYKERKVVRTHMGVNYDGANGETNFIENNFYILPYSKLKAGFCIPCIMTFRGKQFKPSQHIMTTALELSAQGIEAREMVVDMTSVEAVNAKGQKFFIPKFKISTTTTKEEKGLPNMWHSTLEKVDLSAKTQEEDIPAESKKAAPQDLDTSNF